MKKGIKMLKWFIILLIVIAVIHLVEGLTRGRTISYKDIAITTNKMPANEAYTVAFVTDVHNYPLDKLQKVVNKINERRPNLLLLGGDFAVDEEVMRKEIEVLSKVKTIDGIYGVEGNHDYTELLFEVMTANGIKTLQNEGKSINQWLYLAGTMDFWNQYQVADISSAVAATQDNQFVLLLTHNADITMQQGTKGIDLTLSGHSHGGEVSLFGLWAPAMPRVSYYGQKFLAGMTTSKDETPVYISRGIGGWLPMRIFAQPEVTFITITGNKAI